MKKALIFDEEDINKLTTEVIVAYESKKRHMDTLETLEILNHSQALHLAVKEAIRRFIKV